MSPSPLKWYGSWWSTIDSPPVPIETCSAYHDDEHLCTQQTYEKPAWRTRKDEDVLDQFV
jgi:hypothetical protein